MVVQCRDPIMELVRVFLERDSGPCIRLASSASEVRLGSRIYMLTTGTLCRVQVQCI